jgi:hypothetical protein
VRGALARSADVAFGGGLQRGNVNNLGEHHIFTPLHPSSRRPAPPIPPFPPSPFRSRQRRSPGARPLLHRKRGGGEDELAWRNFGGARAPAEEGDIQRRARPRVRPPRGRLRLPHGRPERLHRVQDVVGAVRLLRPRRLHRVRVQARDLRAPARHGEGERGAGDAAQTIAQEIARGADDDGAGGRARARGRAGVRGRAHRPPKLFRPRTPHHLLLCCRPFPDPPPQPPAPFLRCRSRRPSTASSARCAAPCWRSATPRTCSAAPPSR